MFINFVGLFCETCFNFSSKKMLKEWYNWVFETEIVKSVRNSIRSVNYAITAQELSHLMEYKGMEAVEQLEKMGGILGLCKKLDVSIYEGLLSDEDIKERRRFFGKNKLIATTSKTLPQLIFEAFQDQTLIMLEICAIISLILSFFNQSHKSDKDLDENPWLNSKNDTSQQKYGFIEAIAILLSIILTVLVMACSEYGKEAKFRALQNRLEKEHKINVLRFGTIIEIPTSDLVVGDICIIKYGDVIPADGILFECNELRVDESSLTGESDLVNKQPDKDITLYAGTHVMEGSGRMIVVAVGDHSQTGLIYALMKSGHNGKSILQCKLADLAVQIGYFGMSVAAITIVMLIIRSCIIDFVIEQQKFEYRHIKEFFNHVITGITILVVAVPEGLPLAVTLSLAYSVKQMMKDNNLVRHIDACETMGNATTICSDKTGTLTANRMTAVQCYLCGVYYTQLSKRRIGIREDIADILAQNIALNSASTSRVVREENNQIKQYGNKTECALLGLLHKLKYDYVKIRNEFPEKNFHRVFSFNSTRKLMRTIIKLPDDKGFRLLAKGASEMILKKCSFIVGKFGTILKLTMTEKDQIDNKILKVMAKNGLRVIVLSYLDYYFENPGNDPARRIQNVPVHCKLMKNNIEPDWESEESYSDMTCLSVVGIEDPIKKDVPQAIRMCQKSGISIKMITGDNIDTARSIAIKCGIISDSAEDNNDKTILESKEYNRIIRNEDGEVDQAKFDQVWPHLKVLARSTPMDKYILVKHIIESNIRPVREVVAVTGDGTNDAPALKMADVGFAMGIAGTEVAKEASDIILTDDNFSSIVKAVIWGRNVYDSIAKFIQFQLTVNIVAVLICFISSCIIQESPLRPVQMLWVNLIMDTLGSLSLATEPPSKVLLLRKPYGRNKSLISMKMLQIIILNSLYQLAVLVLFLFYGHELFDFDSGIRLTKYSPVPNVHFTMLFNIFVMMTLFNEINSRKITFDRNVFEGITNNWVFCTIFFTTFIMQVLIVQFGNIIFTTHPLNLSQWIWSLAFGISQLVWGQIVTSISLNHPSPKWCQKIADVYG